MLSLHPRPHRLELHSSRVSPQTLPVKRGMLYEEVASIAQSKWNGNNNIGLVVGATDTLAMSKARAAAPVRPHPIGPVGPRQGSTAWRPPSG